MLKWFKALSKAARNAISIVPLVLGGAFLVFEFIFYDIYDGYFLMIGGVLLIAVSIFFIWLNSIVVKEIKHEKEEAEFERKKAEMKEKGISDAAKIPDSELDSQIEINDEKFNRYQQLIEESKSNEERAQNVYSALYYGNIVETLIERKKAITKERVNKQSELGQADELRKFKELLDDGVITQEEFDYKKNQIIGKK